MKASIAKVALLCALLSLTTSAFGQKRKPTPDEERAIAKYITVMNRVLNQFRSPDWDEAIDDSIDHTMINIMDDRPFDIDQQLKRTYTVRKDSRRYQTLVAPRLEKIAQLKDATQRDLERAHAEDLMHLQVEVHFNMWVVPMITAPDPKKDPKIPGATFVHMDRDNPFNHGVAYVLFFSNGRMGKWDETNAVYRNVFIHKPNTPYIENLEIRIYGAEDRIKQLLHTIDWKQVNSALTK